MIFSKKYSKITSQDVIFGAGDILSPGSKLSISFLTVTVNHKYLQKKYVYDIINRTNGNGGKYGNSS